MGCPPDPYEVAAAQSIEKAEASHTRYGTLFKESRETRKTARRLLAMRGVPAELAGPLTKALHDLEQRPATPRAEVPDRGKTVFFVGDGNYGSLVDAPVNAVIAEEKALELELCIARDGLLRLARALGRLNDNDVLLERDRHLGHRQDDVRTKLEVLRRDLEFLEWQRTDPDYSKEKTPQQFAQEIAALKADIERIGTLTDEELLTSRAAF